MKIRKITTHSFPISEKKENRIEKKLGGGMRHKIMKAKGEVKIRRGYLPLAKYKLSRQEKTKNGFEARENLFYIDLNKAEIYHIKENSIMKYDLPRKIIDLPRESITELGNLLRYGSRYREELNPDVVEDLIDLGLVDIYKLKGKQLAALLIDELSADPAGRTTQTKEHIKAVYPLPKFNDRGYDLANYLETDDVIVESYQKDPIKYSTDRIGKTLKHLFNAKASLEAMVFIPYLIGEYSGRDKYKKKASDMHHPVCYKTDRKHRRKEGIKLKPIALNTEIGSKDAVPMETSTIDFTDVVGLEKVKKEIEDSIIRPIREPELARKFGKKGGGAILLYGPPGCGKTYLAKATIGECAVPFYNVNISDIVNLGAEEGAKSLHQIFDEANRNSPSIIFFDEIDAIGGKRDSGQAHTEKMGVTQLLVEIDGAQSMTENVLIIAATNAPWAVDPALRRAGRFTKQIFVPPPDQKDREQLFKIHTKRKPVSAGIDYRHLAGLTEGYSSSDIKAVCDKTLQILWDETSKGIEREITLDDFSRAIGEHETSLTPWFRLAQKEIRKSGEADLYRDFSEQILKHAGGVNQVHKPKINFSDVGGMEAVKAEIRRAIVHPIEKPELARKFGRAYGGGVLLYGPPGCGKTYIAKATAGECNASFFSVSLTDILSPDAGESERNIREIFERASKNTPAVLFFDEFDAIASRRDLNAGEAEKRIINQFLVEMDGFMDRKDIMIIAATNAPWAVDPALRRSGRFTKQILVPPPDQKAREEIFRIHTRKKPVAGDIDYRRLAGLTEGYSSSDIKALCDRAAEIPWDEALSGGVERDICLDDFMKAVGEQKTSLKPWFRMAVKQITESGEEDVYPELFRLIRESEGKSRENPGEREDFTRVGDGRVEIIPPNQGEEDEEIQKLVRERRGLEDMIDLARIRYNEGVINREDFELIVMHYQMQVIGLEVKIKELKNPSIGHDPFNEPEALFGERVKALDRPKNREDEGIVWMKDIEWSVAQNPGGSLNYRIRAVRGDVYRTPQ